MGKSKGGGGKKSNKLPIFEAADNDDVDAVRDILSEHPTARDAKNNQGDSALHYAVVQGYEDIVEYLASKGAPLELKDKDGETPLDVAGKDKKMKKLLERLIKEREEDGDSNEKKDMDEDEWEEEHGMTWRTVVIRNVSFKTDVLF
eukprot:gene1681-33077_t